MFDGCHRRFRSLLTPLVLIVFPCWFGRVRGCAPRRASCVWFLRCPPGKVNQLRCVATICFSWVSTTSAMHDFFASFHPFMTLFLLHIVSSIGWFVFHVFMLGLDRHFLVSYLTCPPSTATWQGGSGVPMCFLHVHRPFHTKLERSVRVRNVQSVQRRASHVANAANFRAGPTRPCHPL